MLGSIAIFISYYEVQILNPENGRGILDFVTMAGTVGGLFVVPTFIIIRSCLKKYMYCFVIFSAFITIPNLMLHSGSAVVTRLINCLDDDHSIYWLPRSPYYEVGKRLKETAGIDSKYIPAACKIFERGSVNKGVYNLFAPRNLYLLILTQYESGDLEPCRNNIKELLHEWPRVCAFLVTIFHDYHYKSYKDIYPEIEKLSQEFLEKTGNPIYAKISKIYKKKHQKCPISFFTGEYYSVVIVLLDYDTPLEIFESSHQLKARGKEILIRLGLSDLIKDPHPEKGVLQEAM